MLSLRSLLLPLLCALATASPVAGPQQWECYNFRRVCALDGSTCTYNFAIAQGPFPDFEARSCEVTVRATEGVTAAERPFTDVPCTFARQLRVSAGWDSAGRFTTLVARDIATNKQAFFGFTEAEMANGNFVELKRSPPSPVLKLSRRQTDPTDVADIPIYVPEPQSSWEFSVHNVHRYIISSHNEVHLSMTIDDGVSDGGEFCQVAVVVPWGEDPETASWFNMECTNSHWRVSWGYDEKKDSAVMTVVAPGGDVRAWFGWDHVNDSEFLADNGPNPATH